jgi:hypothetical protein
VIVVASGFMLPHVIPNYDVFAICLEEKKRAALLD